MVENFENNNLANSLQSISLVPNIEYDITEVHHADLSCKWTYTIMTNANGKNGTCERVEIDLTRICHLKECSDQ